MELYLNTPKNYLKIPNTIVEHVCKRRVDLKLTQKQLAKIIGVTESTVWNWEHELNPFPRHMKKIEEFLGYKLKM